MRFAAMMLGVLALSSGFLASAALAGQVETYGMVFVCDGAKGDAFYDFAKNGYRGRAILPNVKKYFLDEGAWVKNATTVFPTITGAGMPAVLTGCYPGRHDLPSLYFFDRRTKQYPVLYTPLEALDWDSWLSPSVKTIWEHFEGPNDALSFGPALHRGADEHISILYNLKYKPMELRGKLKASWRRVERIVAGGLPARITVVYNGWFDHMEHGLGARADEQIPHYEAVDAQIGEAVEGFKEVIAERRAAGADARFFIALTSDHGHQDVRDVQSIDKFIKDSQGAKTVERIWTQLFGQKINGEAPKDLSTFDLVCAAGEGHALLYFPILRNGVRDWDTRPSLSLLRAFPFKGQIVDLPMVAVQQEAAVRFVTAKDHDSGTVWVFAKKGDATIERKVEGARTTYRYKVVRGVDPLDFAGHAPARPLMDDKFHDQREWQLATVETDSPDGVVQLYQVFDSPRAADLFLSAAPYISIGDLVDGAKSKSKHGGLTRDEAWCTVAFHGTGIPPMEIHTARNVDVVPTMFALMGKDYDASKLDGEPIPDLMARVREATAGLPAGAADRALKALEDHVARLAGTKGDEITAWALGFQTLASRPGLKADRVKALREQAHRDIAARTDAAARAVVAGEVAAEFLARPRPDLPRGTASGTGRPPLDPTVAQGLAREAADSALRRVNDLLQQVFDQGSAPDTDAGRKALAEIDRNLALVAALHQAGLLRGSPAFSFDIRRNGPNLRYEGFRDGPMSQESRTALSEFVRIEHARADGVRGILFAHGRAKIQESIGVRLTTLSTALAAPSAGTGDLAAAIAALPPGGARATAEWLQDYRASTAPRAAGTTAPLAGATAAVGAVTAPVTPPSGPPRTPAGSPVTPTEGRSVLDTDTP